MNKLRQALFPGILILIGGAAHGLAMHMSFPEVIQSSKLVFIGTVKETAPRLSPTGKMVFTDVYFTDVELIHKEASFALGSADGVTLSFAGGEWQERRVVVSGVPTFKAGERFLLCVAYDDPFVANPLTGGPQGLFRIEFDEETGQEYPLAYGRRGIMGLDSHGELRLSSPIESIVSGRAAYAFDPLEDLRYLVAPTRTPDSPSPGSTARVSEVMATKQVPLSSLLDLEAFLKLVEPLWNGKKGAEP